MLDDDDQKIRRNLIAFSALTLVIAWFGISVTEQAQRLLSSSATLRPEDALAAALAAAAYLGLRFRFMKLDDQTQAPPELRRDAEQNLLYGYLSEAIESSKTSPLRNHAAVQLKDAIQAARTQALEGKGDADRQNLSILILGLPEVNWSFADRAKWSGRIDLLLNWPGFQSKASTEYVLPRRDRALIAMRALLSAYLYSRTAVQYTYPVLLFSGAVGVLVVRVVALYWSV